MLQRSDNQKELKAINKKFKQTLFKSKVKLELILQKFK